MTRHFSKQKFTLMDIVLMALLAAANGVLTFFLSFVNKALYTIGGPILTSTIVGVYMIYGVLAVYIIRKPGTATITYFIGAFVQIILGVAYGMASALVASACYAFAIELIFFLMRYRRWSYFAVSLASFSAVPLWFLCAAYMFGYVEWPLSILILAFLVRCISGVVMCGLIVKWIGDRLLRTGLLRGFEAGADATPKAGA